MKKPKKKAAPLASPEATDLSDAGSAGPSSATTSIPTAGSAAEPGTPSDASAMTSEFGMMSLKQSAALPIPEHLLPRKSKSKRSGHAASMSRIESMTARETLRRMDSNTIPSVKHTPDAAADGCVSLQHSDCGRRGMTRAYLTYGRCAGVAEWPILPAPSRARARLAWRRASCTWPSATTSRRATN